MRWLPPSGQGFWREIQIYLPRREMQDGKLANVEFETIANVKDSWKELNPK